MCDQVSLTNSLSYRTPGGKFAKKGKELDKFIRNDRAWTITGYQRSVGGIMGQKR